MKYSTIICTRNRCEILSEALHSHTLLEIPNNASREIVIVDNGSTDQTREIVQKFQSVAPFDVKYLYESREGHSVALNTGCRAAQGDVLVFTDDDAFPDINWLAAIHDTFVRTDADWVYGPVVPKWPDNRVPNWYGPFSSQFVACLDRGTEEFVAFAPEQHFAGVNHACKRNKIYELGLYREDYGILPGGKSYRGNDDELFQRALSNGCKIVYNPRILVNHSISLPRVSKRIHRENIIKVAINNYCHYVNSKSESRTILRIPLIHYYKLLENSYCWLIGFIKKDKSFQFYNEIQMLRHSTIILCSIRDYVR